MLNFKMKWKVKMNDNMNDLLKRLEHQIQSHKLWQQNDALYVACSGGVDSVVLVHLLISLGFKPIILHCNYHLRDEESNRDEAFVRSMGAQLNLEVNVKSFDTKKSMQDMGKGVQEVTRMLRYEWFEEMLNAHNLPNAFLITAHHRDDQVEGLMMNFFRGTGIAGLKGMIMKREKIIRPLLDFSREEILHYAEQHQISWVDDSSNAESKYTRNLFRNELIPHISKVYPSFQDNLIQNARRFSEIELIYRKELDRLKSKLLKPSLDGWKIPVNLIRNIIPLDTVLFEIFTSFGFSAGQAVEIKKLFDAETGRFFISSTHRVLKNRDWLLIEPISSSNQQLILIHEKDTEITFDTHTITQSRGSERDFNQNKMHAFIHAKELQYPLILRKWKTGDYFYPLGMKKKKKLSKFMTDIKLSRIEKENQWVIESNKKIIWVVGQRMDDRFKITDQSMSVVVFKLL